jgi:penicillin G amidase
MRRMTLTRKETDCFGYDQKTMRIFKLIFSLVITLGLIYFLDNRWVIGDQAIPPLGRFLDPFHGFWQNVESRNQKTPAKLKLTGLKDEVTIVFDSLMIPHIFAKNDEDLYYAQGYVTAYHRLWQLEFQTHAAAGRISEIVGSDAALEFDRNQRRLGMSFGAHRAMETMMKDPHLNMMLTRYSDGINAYINTLGYADLPFEYKLLHYQPEAWTPLKTAYLLKNLSKTLNIMEGDLEMTNALKLFGRDMIDLLYAESDHPAGDPIVEKPGQWNFTPVRFDSIPLAVPHELVSIPGSEAHKKGTGSNNWAVHGSKTATGAPILCNDPHLTLSLPSIWYVVHLNAPGINTMGASLPGAPGVVIGFNDSVAWGVTNANRDLADWYAIRFRDASYNQYLSDGQWKNTRKEVEVFNVRGREPFYDTVVYTHHGPVVYDKSFKAENEKNQYAFRWLAHDGSEELRTLDILNRSKNYNDFTEAMKSWSGPAQNFIFASVGGDIAIQVQGKFPVRRKDEGKFILDGANTNTEWKAFIPQDHLVKDLNPARGFVSSANQFPADATYPYYIHSDSYEAYRNRRINDLLRKMDMVKVGDMMKLQLDNYNLKAAESLPLMLSLLDVSTLRGEESRIAEALTFWDFVNSKESLAASYYEAWWKAFVKRTFDEFSSAGVRLQLPDEYSIVRLMKTKPDLVFFDIADTPEKETLADIVRISFHDAAKSIQEWENNKQKSIQWADFKDTRIQHLLQLDVLSRSVRSGGNEGIVNATSGRKGPSWRYIVSLEKKQVRAWGVYPAGQSGNPGSAFYDSFINSWAQGTYYPLLFTDNAAATEPRAWSITNLKPSN